MAWDGMWRVWVIELAFAVSALGFAATLILAVAWREKKA